MALLAQKLQVPLMVVKKMLVEGHVGVFQVILNPGARYGVFILFIFINVL